MHKFRLGRLDKIKWRIHGLITRFTCHDSHAVCFIEFIHKLSRPNRMGYKPWLVKPCAPLNIFRHSHGCHTRFQSHELAYRALNSHVTAWQKPWNFFPSRDPIYHVTAWHKPWVPNIKPCSEHKCHGLPQAVAFNIKPWHHSKSHGFH